MCNLLNVYIMIVLICNVVMYCTQNAYCTWHERVRGKDRREKDGEREGVRDRGDT